MLVGGRISNGVRRVVQLWSGDAELQWCTEGYLSIDGYVRRYNGVRRATAAGWDTVYGRFGPVRRDNPTVDVPSGTVCKVYREV